MELVKPLGAQKIRTESQMPDTELKICTCMARCFFLVKSDCFYALILLFWNKKIVNLFLTLQKATVKRLGILKKLSTFERMEGLLELHCFVLCINMKS